MRLKIRYAVWLVLASVAWAPGNAYAEEDEESNATRLEIREYRFSRHTDYDRLVLQFERKDSGGTKPGLKTERAGRDSNVHVSNALLLGAVPESLINDSYVNKARFLGPISVNMETQKTGFTIKVGSKRGGARVKASWLNNPPRLVLDGYSSDDFGQQVYAPSKGGLRHPSLGELLCFPATSKVGLTVIFKPRTQHVEELQNIRVNTDGTNPPDSGPSSDAIVCYPRKSQIQAALSFEEPRLPSAISKEMPPEHGGETAQSAAAAPTLPPMAGSAPALPPMAKGHESDLDPGPTNVPQGLGQLPSTQPPPRLPAHESADTPLSLLPPLPK